MSEDHDSTKLIEGTRLVAGYIRDAAVSHQPFVFTLDNNEFVAFLTQINESSARETDNHRKLQFRLSRNKNNLNLREINETQIKSIHGRVALDRALLKFNTTVLYKSEHILEVECPNIATLVSERENYRLTTDSLIPKSSLVSISKIGKGPIFAYFEIEDISKDGIGGIVYSDVKLPPIPFSVSGAIRYTAGKIHLKGDAVLWE